MTEELPDSVSKALDPETFDVLDFVTGKGTPKGKVTIYTDAEAGYRLAELAEMEAANADRAEVEGLGIADEVEWVDPDEVQALRDRIESSALVFDIQGLAPAEKKAIRLSLVAKHNYKESEPAEDQEAYFTEYSLTLISKTITGVTRGDGSRGSNVWTNETVQRLRDQLNETEFARLDNAVYNINFETAIYDRAASADFLSKR